MIIVANDSSISNVLCNKVFDIYFLPIIVSLNNYQV